MWSQQPQSEASLQPLQTASAGPAGTSGSGGPGHPGAARVLVLVPGQVGAGPVRRAAEQVQLPLRGQEVRRGQRRLPGLAPDEEGLSPSG